MRTGTSLKSALAILALALSSYCKSASAYQAPPNPPTAGYTRETPASLSCIYQLVSPVAGCNPNNTSLNPNLTLGAGAIVVVSQYHYANLAADLATYSSQFGLPAPNLTVTTSSTPTTCNDYPGDTDLLGRYTAYNCFDYGEDALEVAHAMAPKAPLILIETGTSESQIEAAFAAAATAAKAHSGGEVVLALVYSESSGDANVEPSLAPSSSNTNVLFFAPSGQAGSNYYPGTSPNVVSVSASDIARDMEKPTNIGNVLSERTGQAGAGGFSAYVAMPSYQNRLLTRVGGTRMRAVPDIVATSNGNDNIWVYNSDGHGSGWYGASSPHMATAIAAGIANAANASSYFQSTSALLTSMYSKIGTSAFYDVGIGICGAYDGAFTTVTDRGGAVDQWDFCSGIGAPRGLTGFRP